jgi:hypothetical protein
VNRKPIPAVVSLTLREDITTDVAVGAYDPDGNAMTIIVETLPALGILYINKSTTSPVVKGSTYNIPDNAINAPFSFGPSLHLYGTDFFQYYVSDGCARSASINATLTISFYDYPPVVYSVSMNTSENTATTVTLNGTDVETQSSGLSYIILSLPDPTLAVLKRVSTGNNVQVNDVFNPGENTVRLVPVTYACCDNAQFTYQVEFPLPLFCYNLRSFVCLFVNYFIGGR